MTHEHSGATKPWLTDPTQRTDNGLATRFIDNFGQDVRYVSTWGKWIVWDGKRFKLDKGGNLVLQKGRKFAKRLWADFQLAASDARISRDECNAARSFCFASNKAKGIWAFLELARSDDRVLIDHSELNAKTSLLNLQNGTYDVVAEELREHRQTDLLTQVANVSYGESAECPQWIESLNVIFDGDVELIRYVQQMLGYSLAGGSGEHILPIAYGAGCNGKSFIWNTVIELAGCYGTVANESLLLGKKDSHPTEKAHLYQKRIVALSEPEQGTRMRESRVKELTGDAFVTARHMYEDNWTFRRTHTFWLSSNHLPRITGRDDGIWRRIKVIPFTVDLRDKVELIADYHLQVLADEGPGILNWLLDGYRDHQLHGFLEPAAVKRLGSVYREEQDHLAAFISDCCQVSQDQSVRGGDLYAAYERWGGSWSNVAFGKEMGNRFTKCKPTTGPNRNRNTYLGIGLVNEDA